MTFITGRSVTVSSQTLAVVTAELQSRSYVWEWQSFEVDQV